MRTHQEIVTAHGATALVRDLAGIGLKVSRSTPQRWADRNSIPVGYWRALEALEVATMMELATSATVASQAA